MSEQASTQAEQSMKRDNEKFCKDCGSKIHINAEICPKCGVRQMPLSTSNPVQTSDMLGVPQVRVRNYMAHSIISIFFFLPLGIAALVSSMKVDSSLSVGNIAQAQLSSKRAKLFVNLAVLSGFLLALLYVLFVGALMF